MSDEDSARMRELAGDLSPFLNTVAKKDETTGTYVVNLDDNEVQKAIYNAVYDSFKLTREEFNDLYAEAIARDSDSKTTEINNASSQGEKFLNQNATDQDIIKKMRDALLSDSDAKAEDVLDADELTRFNEIMGDTPATVENLENKMAELDTAAHNCATSLQKLNTAILNDQVDGGYVDASGKVHATNSTEQTQTINASDARGNVDAWLEEQKTKYAS